VILGVATFIPSKTLGWRKITGDPSQIMQEIPVFCRTAVKGVLLFVLHESPSIDDQEARFECKGR